MELLCSTLSLPISSYVSLPGFTALALHGFITWLFSLITTDGKAYFAFHIKWALQLFVEVQLRYASPSSFGGDLHGVTLHPAWCHPEKC